MHLVAFIIRIYHDARSYECHITVLYLTHTKQFAKLNVY